MKGIDIFCASQSSTSTLGGTTTTMEAAAAGSLLSSSSSSSIEHRRGAAIDRHNPIIHDQSRLVKTLLTPPAAPPPSNSQIQDYNNQQNETKKKKQQKIAGKEEKRRSNVALDDADAKSIMNWGRRRRSWSCMNPGGFISPPGSSRYLLSREKTLLNVEQSDSDPVVLKLVSPENSKPRAAVRKDESDADSMHSSPAPVPYQVVLLRVSLHCRGCEKKLRKHISTIQGVSSFNIDFAAKKVTVEGNVTPLEVLASISKVKNAQLWTEMKTQQPTIIM